MWLLDQNEGAIRFAAFVSIFSIMAIFEALMPRKHRVQPRGRRWFTNIALVVIDTAAVRVLIPVLAVSIAQISNSNGWGILATFAAPFWIKVLAGFILLDLLIYAQHVASHKLPLLWAVHKIHHADRDFDVTTGFRFHPIEIVLSMLFKLVCIVIIGPPAIAVLIFEVLLSGSAMFNHANVRLPLRLDRLLRLVVVTPDMHRVHHSTIYRETDSNYGFCLSIWDYLFRTYIPQPQMGHDNMTIGLNGLQDDRPSSLRWSLTAPFKRIGNRSTRRHD